MVINLESPSSHNNENNGIDSKTVVIENKSLDVTPMDRNATPVSENEDVNNLLKSSNEFKSRTQSIKLDLEVKNKSSDAKQNTENKTTLTKTIHHIKLAERTPSSNLKFNLKEI